MNRHRQAIRRAVIPPPPQTPPDRLGPTQPAHSPLAVGGRERRCACRSRKWERPPDALWGVGREGYWPGHRPCAYRRSHDPEGTRRPGAPAPSAGPHGPRLRRAPRRPGDGARGTHVARAFLTHVPRGIRRNALFLSDDPTHRAGEGAAAPGDVGHRYLRHRRVYLARLVQLAVHRDRRRDALGLPGARPSPPRGRAVLREQGGHPPEAHPGHQRRRGRRPSRRAEQDRRSIRRIGAPTVVA